MTTALTSKELPAPTPRTASSLSPQELAAHRETIAFEVRAVLSAYFQPHESEEIRAAQLAWWCDELQDWTREQVVWALRQWNRNSPRYRPTPGDISAILKKKRGEKIAEEMRRKRQAEPEQELKRVSPEAATAILREAGLTGAIATPKRFGGDA